MCYLLALPCFVCVQSEPSEFKVVIATHLPLGMLWETPTPTGLFQNSVFVPEHDKKSEWAVDDFGSGL